MIQFRVSCIPPKTTHQAKKLVRIRGFSRLADTRELVEAKATLDSLLLEHQPTTPILGPVVLELVFEWPWRKGEAKKVRARGRIPMVSKPDCSNIAKTIEDRLVALRFIEDDAHVVDLQTRKWWGDTPGIFVRITPFGDALPGR